MTHELEPDCPKCKAPMQQGYLLDRAMIFTAGTWVEGEPAQSFWGRRSTKGKDGPRIRAMRCRRCGFLELYADGPHEKNR